MGSTTARSGVLLGAGVLTSLSLHSNGRGRSYLRALIYDFFLNLFFSLIVFWSFFVSMGAWEKAIHGEAALENLNRL